MKIKTFSGIGARRRQEDAYAVVQNPYRELTVAIVADGMGGHEYGDEASKTVIDALYVYWNDINNLDNLETKIADSIKYAANVYEKMANGREMGSTLVMAVIVDKAVYIAHCGDSRVYIWHKANNQYFHTNDHTRISEFGYELVANAFFTGICQDIKPAIRELDMKPGDRLMLCTDGVFKFIPHEELRKVLTSNQNIEGVSEDLEAYCMVMSGDNYTAVIIEF